MWTVAATIAVLLSADAGTDKSAQDAAAKRFVAALRSKGEYVAADFVKPLRDKDKVLFAPFAKCRPDSPVRPIVDTPQKPGVYAEVPDEITITWRCRGVSPDTPVGLTLVFKGTRIATIETHNVDLMRAD